jgi:hypothetical protein
MAEIEQRGINIAPNAAYQDSSGDKPTPIEKLHFRDYFRDWLTISCFASAAIRLAWIFSITGSPSTHFVIMLTLGFGGFASFLLFVLSFAETKQKLPKWLTRWSLLFCLGIAMAFILHYPLFN